MTDVPLEENDFPFDFQSHFEDNAERERVIEFVLSSLNHEYKKNRKPPDLLKDGVPIQGYNHERKFELEDFVSQLLTTGFQATNLGRAIEILREVRDRNIPLYLGFTSNIGTCGLRETITYLTKHRHIRALATTAGAVEEDVMKVMAPFIMGDFRADGADLYQRSIHRTGNIFIPMSRYTRLHLLLYLLHKRLWKSHFKTKGFIDVVEYVYELGRQLELMDFPRREESFVYWAYKNKIDLYCPVLLDGAIGDSLYYFQRETAFRYGSARRLIIDVMGYASRLIDDMMVAKHEAGSVALWAIGGSVPKHMLCNAAIFTGGARHAIYVNTATEADGSNAGAPIDEAITWGKVHAEAKSIKVEAEATLVVPLMVAAAYQCYQPHPGPPLPEDVSKNGQVSDRMEQIASINVG